MTAFIHKQKKDHSHFHIISLFKINSGLFINFKNLSRFKDNLHNIQILLPPGHFPHLFISFLVCLIGLLFVSFFPLHLYTLNLL